VARIGVGHDSRWLSLFRVRATVIVHAAATRIRHDVVGSAALWLLAIMALVSIASGWFTVRLSDARARREAVDAIHRLGGSVLYDWELSELGHGAVVGAKPPQPEWLRQLLGGDFFDRVHSVVFQARPFTDEDVKYLLRFPEVEALFLFDAPITDKGLEHLTRLSQLNNLVLDGTKITDAGLQHLIRLPRLDALALDRTRISDEGLVHVSKIARLVTLSLGDTDVTDAGMEHLTKLSKLHCLYIARTKVSEKGMTKLKSALPKLEFGGDI
jgi:hypothetical protein